MRSDRSPARRGGIVALVTLVAVGVIAGGGAAFVLRDRWMPGDASAGLVSPDWSEYLGPARVGYDCTLEAVDDQRIRSSSEIGVRVVGVTDTPDGRRIEMETDRSAQVEPPPELVPSPGSASAQVESRTISYVMNADGELVTSPLVVGMSDYMTSTEDVLILPSVASLRAGQRRETSIDFTMELDWVNQQFFHDFFPGALEPGATKMTVRTTVVVEGVDSPPVNTPAGVFTDIVGVQVSFTDLRLAGAPDATYASEALDPAQVWSLQFERTRLWFARDVGLVQLYSSTMIGGPVAELTGCSG